MNDANPPAVMPIGKSLQSYIASDKLRAEIKGMKEKYLKEKTGNWIILSFTFTTNYTINKQIS